MIAEALMMATTVWYIPGWMRTDALRSDLANYGAKGSPVALTNVCERVVPEDFTKEVEIEPLWGKVQLFKDIANHHDIFYFEYLKRVLSEN